LHKGKVSIHDASRGCPPKLCYNRLFLLRKASCENEPTFDGIRVLLIEQFDSRIMLNLLKNKATIVFDIFTGYNSKLGMQQNHFHEFWTRIEFGMNFESSNWI
jgi:hypothetical protein